MNPLPLNLFTHIAFLESQLAGEVSGEIDDAIHSGAIPETAGHELRDKIINHFKDYSRALGIPHAP